MTDTTRPMALDSGKVTLNSSFDARGSLRYGRFNISDYHAQNRVLTERGMNLDYKVGTMIELPRAALMVAESTRDQLDTLAADLKLDAALSKPFTRDALVAALRELEAVSKP